MGKSTQHDWVARTLAIIGSVTGIAGIVLSFLNYHWQQGVHEQSLEERVYVHLSAARIIEFSPLFPSKTRTPEMLDPDGKLSVEVVNIGDKPVYLKSVMAQFQERTATFQEYDPLDSKDLPRKLEPGEEASYTIDWKFAEHETPLVEVPELRGVIEVETTKKRFSLQASVGRYSFNEELLPLIGGRNFGRLAPSKTGTTRK
jgi:hypothetical protein